MFGKAPGSYPVERGKIIIEQYLLATQKINVVFDTLRRGDFLLHDFSPLRVRVPDPFAGCRKNDVEQSPEVLWRIADYRSRSLFNQSLKTIVAAGLLVCIITLVLLKTLQDIAKTLRVFSLPTACDPVHAGARAREIFAMASIVMLNTDRTVNRWKN